MPSWLPASLPSPPEHTWYLGVVPVRAYAVALLAGIVVAAWVTMVRWRARGGDPWDVLDVAFWAVPFGLVGGRIYHVLSLPETYFGSGADPLAALRLWEGGLAIWGAVAFGALGAWIGCRVRGLRFASFADAVAPGLLLGQAVGRLGDWFNQELYGRPTDLPWALEITREHLVTNPATGVAYPEGTTFHPTFLYEVLWNLLAAGVLLFLDRRFKFGHGRVFWAYVVLYTLGRVWIEMMRIDETEILLGLRLNVWTSVVLGLVALAMSVVLARRFPQREESVEREPDPGTTGTGPETMRRA
ncbi:prolipoprotein diacylglyceryl transferase [Myceligenerans indicum]|uniref:Phosphatidylglycerol--prolipoprotein diacylglyceryl transferase n=1 Tax=Myceligenerans indicum TaxID=2593663 RepID=A0ABS1LJK8_9MICO|nr:prolipoprotein diacylglyceryl transferase [Myceligenerans indicum]MBL0886339.1 prolipoprotein diacylglyceryl transferase [Myceligenerans indicum]